LTELQIMTYGRGTATLLKVARLRILAMLQGDAFLGLESNPSFIPISFYLFLMSLNGFLNG
ncbi:MAG: hypothetical protein AAFR25_01255, partial [Cyanobacteria bacterium J06629_19]